MKQILCFLCLLIPLHLGGGSYDTPLLQIGSKLFPKILFIEKGTKERIQSSIQLVIVTTPSYQETARLFSNMVQNQYPEGISNIPLRITVVSPKEAFGIKNAHGIVLMTPPDEPLLDPLIKQTYENKTLTFCFNPALLKNGAVISLNIGKNVKPYLNVTAVKEASFTFEYSFIKLSTLFE